MLNSHRDPEGRILTRAALTFWDMASQTAPKEQCCQECHRYQLCVAFGLWCDNAINGILTGQEWPPRFVWPKLETGHEKRLAS